MNVDGFESERSPAIQVQASSLTLRDGVDGYLGTRDATIFESDPNATRGGSASPIEVDGASGASDKWGLIHWDISDFPEDATVLGATITVNVTDATRGDYHLFELKRDWVEGEVSWNEYSNGMPWQAAGVGGETDRGDEILATFSLDRGTHTVDLNEAGIQVVADWANGTNPNYGFFLWHETTTDGMDFSSREATNIADRPALTLLYVDGSKPLVPGDFNLDGIVGELDIQIMNFAVKTASIDPIFDLDDNRQPADMADRDHLIREILATDYGDSNLDGIFNSSDLVKIFRAGEYEDDTLNNSTWSEGDWNGDGDFTTADLVAAFRAGAYVRASTSDFKRAIPLPHGPADHRAMSCRDHCGDR